MKLISIIVALTLAGCGGPIGSLVAGNVTIYSTPEAGAMRACAALADVATPGISPLAIVELAKGAMSASNALGNTPADAMEKCAEMLRAVTAE